MSLTERRGDAGQNFTEQTYGDLPHSVSLDTNSKGEVQISVKRYFEGDGPRVADDVTDLYLQVARKLTLSGIRVAGYGREEARS